MVNYYSVQDHAGGKMIGEYMYDAGRMHALPVIRGLVFLSFANRLERTEHVLSSTVQYIEEIQYYIISIISVDEAACSRYCITLSANYLH